MPFLVLLFTSVWTLPASAENAGNSSITGKVTGPDGTPTLRSIEVSAYRWDEDDGDWHWSAAGNTSTDGSYTIFGLAAGKYHIQFIDNWGDHLNEWYDNDTSLFSSTDISVGESMTVPNINASLAAAGKITGTITGPDGITPLEGINVFVYQWSDEDENWRQITGDRTSATGIYSAGGLLSGTYRIEFYDFAENYQGEYYNDAAFLDLGQDISVTVGATTGGIDASLVEYGKITGSVTAPDGVTPVGNVLVTAYYRHEGDAEWYPERSVITSSDGSYTLSGLFEKTYRVGFFDNDGNFLAEYYNDVASVDSARDIAVAAHATVAGINASLGMAGKISGSITGQDGGKPLEEIFVRAYRWNEDNGEWDRFGEAETDEEGLYVVGGLPAGSYRLRFNDASGVHLMEYYDNSPDIHAAHDITVTVPGTVTGIDASLSERAKITGRITAADGTTPLVGIEVRAYYWNDDWEGWTYDEKTLSSADGTYTLRGLDAGNYRVGFRDPEGGFAPEYHDNTPTLEAADDIELGASGTISGIDATLEEASHITGTVTRPDGTPLRDVYVAAYRWNEAELDWSWTIEAYTGADGGYSIDGLSAGTYRIGFYDQGDVYLVEYYDGAPVLELASNVTVGTAATVSGIDASLAMSGKITGKITGPDGVTPLGNIEIQSYVWNAMWQQWDYSVDSQSDSDGSYAITGLRQGIYRVEFRDWNGRYLSEYYDNATTITTASDITIGTSLSVDGVNASLVEGGKIAGKITGPDGTTPLENIRVTAFHMGPAMGYWSSVGYADTSADGRYVISNLPPGGCRIEITDPSGEYLDEYYNNVTSIFIAEEIPVDVSATTPGIDASLTRAGKITGIITGADGTTALGDIQVRAYYLNEEKNDWIWTKNGRTSADGRYVITGLAAGKYRIHIHDDVGGHISEYYDDSPSLHEAADIVVGDAATVSGIDASLSDGGSITGRVTEPDGVTPLSNIEVLAYRWNADLEYWERDHEYFYTDENGDYLIPGLKAGRYRLGFHDYEGTYLDEYYGNVPDLDSGTDVVVSGTETIPGIDFSMRADPTSTAEASLSGFRSSGPGSYEMTFKGKTGHFYQLQSSETLEDWADVGAPFRAGFAPATITTSSSEAKMFWRVRSIP